jgi:hypothetical protein
VAVAAVELARQLRQRAQLRCAQFAVRDRDAQHRRVALDVPAVLQPQRPELVFAELAAEMAMKLVAKLCRPLAHDVAVECGVGVHGWWFA